MKNPLFVVTILFLSFQAFAGDCSLTIDRKPCPGQEVAAMKPYDGKNPTVEQSNAKTAADCEVMAEKAAKVVRKKTLSEKAVTGTFDGKPLSKPYTGKGECK